ncbi:ZN862-like protein [Mya arenaria]|uniref:ZN862-like protein n=1 Tax=Mya arenaria TaxID=6604 RepID=A0ABY7FCX2_MYAAR|nr:ZN862-like protein [Mya arenaria]
MRKLLILYYLDFTFFTNNSSLNRSMLKRSFEALKQDGKGELLMPVRVGGTWWIAHTLRAVSNVLGSYKFIEAHLQQLIETSERVGSEAKAKAKAFLKMLQSKSVVYFLNYMLDVLSPLRRLSKLLQDRQAILAGQHAELSSTIKVIRKYTDSDGPNLRKVTQQDTFGELKGSDSEFVSARKHMTLVEFSCPGVVHATRIADLKQWPKSWDNLRDYGDQELQMLNKLPWSWAEIHEVMSKKFQNILPVMDLIMTISPSSAEAERGFSQLKLIKTRLRTRLSQSVLNNLLCIKLEAPSIELFDPTHAINHWNTSRPRIR